MADALADIGKALELDSGNSEALALRSIMAVVQNRQEAAHADAQRAVTLNPDSPAALIALSYAHQEVFGEYIEEKLFARYRFPANWPVSRWTLPG